MAIYLAYRTPYKSKNRFLKKFNYDSIIDFFQDNWDTLFNKTIKDHKDLFGIWIYGFTIHHTKPQKKINKPENFQELIKILTTEIYANTIIGNQECIQIFTDDDELELAWYLFTEKYKKDNIESLQIWFEKTLPLDSSNEGEKLQQETKIIEPKGERDGSTYFISCWTRDNTNLEDLEGVYEIQGIRMPDLANFLRKKQKIYIQNQSWNPGFDDLQYFQKIAKELTNSTLKEIVEFAVKYPLDELLPDNNSRLKIQEIKNLKLYNKPEKSIINLGEHLCELSIDLENNEFKYIVLFDDLWIKKHKTLAKSISNFGTTAKI